MMKIFMSTLLLFLLLTIPLSAKPRPAACRIFPLWIDDTGARSSFFEDVGSFQATGEEGQTLRSFNFEESVVTAGIKHVYDYGKRNQRPYEVRLAITVSGKPETKIFESINSSEAFTLDKKGWNLMVRKSVKLENMTYMFTLSCNDGLKLPRR